MPDLAMVKSYLELGLDLWYDTPPGRPDSTVGRDPLSRRQHDRRHCDRPPCVKEASMSKVLVAYFSETGNTAQVASAIYEEALSGGHEVHLRRVDEIAPGNVSAYDLVFLGSACHSSDLAPPARRVLDEIPPSSTLKLAGFVTHATYTPEGGERQRELHERWASRCIASFQAASAEKGFAFLGYFGCQGAPSPPIEAFIHHTIVTDAGEWEQYIAEVRTHPDQADLQNARAFARQVLAQCREITRP
jgi:flavodoxin